MRNADDFRQGTRRAALRNMLVTSAAVALAAILPNIWAYPQVPLMADGILSIVIFMGAALGFVAFAVLSRWRSRPRKDAIDP